MRIAIVGANGQLGRDVARVFSDQDAIPLGHEEVEVTDAESVRRALENNRPDVVINCAAFVRVEDCEDDLHGSFNVNAIGQANIARLCSELDAICVFISTDYVFDGSKGTPYHEDDHPHPVNVYGTSKLAGEFLTEQYSDRWVIVRLSSLFGAANSSGRGGNFVETILARARTGEALEVVTDITMSPTYTTHAAELLRAVVLERKLGIFHLANDGTCTWYEFAKAIVGLAVPEARIEPTTTEDYPTRARRPTNSALTSRRLQEVGVASRPWQEGLAAYLAEKGYI